MSAFQVTHAHLSAIVTAWYNLGIYASEWRIGGVVLDRALSDNRHIAFAQLAQANADSVNYRYLGDVAPPVTGFRPNLMPTIAAIKAIDCLVYQSCETPTWAGSEPAQALDALRDALTRKLPGYDEAAWSIS